MNRGDYVRVNSHLGYVYIRPLDPGESAETDIHEVFSMYGARGILWVRGSSLEAA
jgi:hypothetical protein